MRIYNEKGAALVIVLFLITLLTLFSMVLFTQLFSTSNQISKQEEETLEADLIEMGRVYFQASVQQAVSELEQDTGVTQESLSSRISALENTETHITNEQSYRLSDISVVLNDEGNLIASADITASIDEYSSTSNESVTIIFE